MATSAVFVPVEEYLRTMYRPDCDYVDGEVLERNMGEKPHARLQIYFSRLFAAFEDEWQVETLTEQRLQVTPTRYRIPDVMLVTFPSDEPYIVRTPPVLCIEVLSSDDRMSRIRERIFDYMQMGVRASWAIDPQRRLAYFARPDGAVVEESTTLTVPGYAIAISVAEIFAHLDRLERRASGSLNVT